MLILCNGAFKSGSTWLHAIVDEILSVKGIKISDIPESFGYESSPTKIRENILLDFIDEFKEDIKTRTFITKSHYYTKDIISNDFSKDVVFLFISYQESIKPG